MTSKNAQKFPTTAVFVAAVMAFAAWTYFYEFKGAQKRAEEKEKSLALLDGPNEELIGIQLKDTEKTAPFNEVRAKRASPSEDWKIEAPFTDLGDKMAFEMLLSGLQTQKIKEVVVEAPDIAWKTFGLDQPQAEGQFTFKGASGERVRRILIGSEPAFDGSVYARIGDENRVVLLDSTVEAMFKREARDLRDKRIFPVAKFPEFQSLTLTRAGKTEKFEKKSGKWELIGTPSKVNWPLDSAKVDELVNSISTMRGQDIWAEDKTDKIVTRGRKLEQPAIVASLATAAEAGKTPETFELKIAQMGKDESLTAAVGSLRPVVFSVNRSQVDSLSKSTDEFRDLGYPFKFEAAEIGAIEIERPARRDPVPGLKRDGDKWLVDAKLAKRGEVDFTGREVSQDSVAKFISELGRIRALRIAPQETSIPGFGKKPDEQGFRAKLKASDGRLWVELVFVEGGDRAVGQFFATSSKVPGRVFVVEKSFVEAVPMELLKPVNSASTSKPTAEAIPSATPAAE